MLQSWARLIPDLSQRSEHAALGAAPKAWRWVGEMQEIAQSFEAAGLPGGFHRAAGELYERLTPFKSEPATLAAILAKLSRS